MKEKKLKKIAHYIANNVMKAGEDAVPKLLLATTPKKGYEEKELSIDCNEETFVKFEKLVNHLLNYDVNIEIYNSYLAIYSDSYKRVKSSKSISNTTNLANESERIEINITKDHFSMNVGYQNRSKFKKEGVYDYFKDLFLEELKKKNNNNFIDSYNSIMKESGLLRDENLENLLKD
jgi:hypothetical protein